MHPNASWTVGSKPTKLDTWQNTGQHGRRAVLYSFLSTPKEFFAPNLEQKVQYGVARDGPLDGSAQFLLWSTRFATAPL